MRLRSLACLVLLAAPGCIKPNLLFDPLETESDGASGGPVDSTGLTEGTGGECPGLAPPAEPLATCELDALSPFTVGAHPVFAGQCDGTPATVWARLSADEQLIEICDENCGACDGPNPIDLNDSSYSFLTVSNILPPAGECMRVMHAGALDANNVCRTTLLTLWGAAPTPRFAAGIDSLSPLPGTGITLEQGDTFLCDCSQADIDAQGNSGPKYPCCATLPIRAGDVVLTPDGGCPVRVLRGPANLTRITAQGSTYEFILHNAYAYEGSCPAARSTIYWTMTRSGA
jgi:hypothetical protein